jgi:hypothetical protein
MEFQTPPLRPRTVQRVDAGGAHFDQHVSVADLGLAYVSGAQSVLAAPRRGDETELYEQFNRRLMLKVAGLVNTSPDIIEDACAFAWVQFMRYQPSRERPARGLFGRCEAKISNQAFDALVDRS